MSERDIHYNIIMVFYISTTNSNKEMSINIITIPKKENGGDIIIVIKYSRVFINENAERKLNFFYL